MLNIMPRAGTTEVVLMKWEKLSKQIHNLQNLMITPKEINR